jgi:hypothetical protein
VLAALEDTVGRHCFESWFRPIVFAGFNEGVCELTVPNETFRASLLENYSDLLRSALGEVLGAPAQIHVSSREDRSSTLNGLLPVVQACRLKAATGGDQWLIENLWLAEAVGIVGGPPRAYKSWLALDMAVSVASGSPCLGMFAVHRTGPVLLYAAEGSDSSLRSRLESIARGRQIDFNALDVRVITVDRLRLDQPDDQERFLATVSLHRPALVVLDPLVRIHGADENASSAVAPLLGYFRALQRKTGASVLLVHHTGKNLSLRAGYSLRGSSDFYAWTDCLLYLERRQEQRRLMVEHRSAPGSGPFTIELVIPSSPDDGPYLVLRQTGIDDGPPDDDSLSERIIHLLSQSCEPIPAETIRTHFRVRKQRLLETLRGLAENGRIARLPQGYILKPPLHQQTLQFPVPAP